MIRRDLAVQILHARAAKIGDRKQSDSYRHMYACAPLCVSVTTQNGRRSLDVLLASRRLDRGSKQSRRSFFFHFQEAERPIGGTPKIALDPLCLNQATLCLFSHINVKNAFIHHTLLLYIHICTHIDTSPHTLMAYTLTHTHAHFLVAHKFHSHICTHVATYTYKFPMAFTPTYYP